MNTFARLRLALLLTIFLLGSGEVNAGGLTIITHGFQPTLPGSAHQPIPWVEAMANSVNDHAGGNASVYKIVIDDDGSGGLEVERFAHESGPGLSSSANSAGEVIVKLYWDPVAGLDATSTGDVAQLAFDRIFNWSDWPNPYEQPIHLIGHSRGASVVSELAKRFGERGIWVDQLTTLDPHPVAIFDDPVHTWETVTFADNYYEVVAYPFGYKISGIFNRFLEEHVLNDGGYQLGTQSSHSDVHLWYHGTLNTITNASNGEQTITDAMRATWYPGNEDGGGKAGYWLSRLGGGFQNRGSSTLPTSSNPYSKGLYSLFYDLPLNRSALPRDAAVRVWPSIVELRTSPISGGRLPVTVAYQDYDSAATIYLALDRDRNPYASAEVFGSLKDVGATGAQVEETTLDLDLANVPSGTYWLQAEISDGVRSRYFYGLTQIEVVNTGGGAATPVATAPAAPTDLASPSRTSTSVNLTWHHNLSKDLGFSVEQRNSNGTWPTNPVKSLGANTTSTSITGLAANTPYTFRVRAKNGTLLSEPSNELTVTTLPVAAASYTLTVEAIDLDTEAPLAAQFYTWVGASTDIQDRTTPQSRTFPAGTEAKIACFPTAGGKSFKFMQQGDNVRTDSTWTIPMTANKTVILAYGSAGTAGKTLAALTIEGPSAVDEDSSTSYKAKASYSDGTTAYVSASWDENSSSADISSSGRLDTEAVSSDKTVEIEADYTAGGITKSATKTVTIRNAVSTQTYTLTLDAVNGHITPSPRGTSFAAGTVVSLTAYPDDGFIRTGWSGDASGNERTVSVRMDRNRSVTAHFAEDTSAASVQVAIQPSQAALEGAGWKVLGKISSANWQPSGDTFGSLKPGSARIIFKDTPGWITPDDIPITLVGGATPLSVTGTYREILGAVQVILTPPQVVQAGARWRLNGGEWRESGTTLRDVPTGPGTIECLAPAGWGAPPAQSITVQRGLTNTLTADFAPPAGLPIVNSISPKTGPIEGGTVVTIEGANFQPGATVTFGGVAGVVTFINSTKLTVVTPPRPSYGTVPLVLTSGGQPVTQGNGFTYTIPLGQNMTLLSQIGGEVNAIALNGNYAFYGEGSSLAVADVSNPAVPVPRGRIALPGTVWGVAVAGNYAVAAVEKWGIQVIDISDVDAPSVVGFYDLPGESLDVVVIDNLAYVAASQAGLFVVDLTDKAAPVKVGEFAGAVGAMDLEMTTIGGQRLACAACGTAGTQILDVTNPATITQRSEIPFGFARALSVSGSDLFAFTTVGGQNAIMRYDLTDPANPQPSSAPIYDSCEEMLFSGGHLYLGRGGLYVRSLANPSQPIETGYVVLPGSTWRMATAGNLLYLANRSGGLVIANVVNEANPSQVATLGGDVSPHDILVSNGYAYLAQGSLAVIDVSAPQRPARVGKFTFSKEIDELAKAGNYLFSASGVFLGAPTLSVANPLNPTEVSVHSAAPSRGSYDVATVGANYLVAGKKKAADGGQAGLWLYDGAAPTNLTPLSTIEGSATEVFRCVAAVGTKAFVANGTGRFTIIEYATPSLPATLGSVEVGDEIVDIAVTPDGSFAYAATLNGGVQAIDCRNTAIPSIAGQYYREGRATAQAVALSGSLVVYADIGSIVVVDFSNPAQPLKVAEYDAPGICNGLATLDDLVFAAEGTAGLEIFRIGDVALPLVEITSPTGTAVPTTSTLITLSGTATDLQGVVRVTWENARGGGGEAQTTDGWQHWTIADIQLAAGVNVLTVTAEDANGNLAKDSLTVTANLPETTGPALLVTGPKPPPAFTTEANPVTLIGTAADLSGVQSVAWANDRGGSGTATGTTAWSADIPLLEGPNRITLTARDTAGNESQTEVLVTFVPPDTTAPVADVTFPTDAQEAATSEAEVNLSGEAEDDRAVTRVTWANNRGGSGEATGTRAWHANGIILQPGVNILTVTAEDAAGNTGTDTLAVTFAPTSADPARPTLRVQTPLAKTSAVEVDTIACTGQASGTAPIREVVWQLNDGPWLAADGTGNWIAIVTPLVPGTNRIRFKAIDDTGRESLPTTRTVTYRKFAPLDLTTTGEGRALIDGKAPPAMLQVARLYTAEAKPAAGWIFAGWEGDVVSQSRRVTFVMTETTTLRAVFIENPYGEIANTYRGLLRAEPLAHATSGAATIALARTGAFTAKITIGGKAPLLPLKGNFGGTGSYLGKLRIGSTRYDVLLALDPATPDAPVTGLLSDGTSTLALNAWPRTRFDTDAPQTGAYTFTLDPGTAPAPTTASTGRMIVSKTGGVRFAARLADGAALARGSAITAGARVPLYHAYDRARASLSAPLTFADKPDSALDGIAFWTTRTFFYEPRLKAVRE